MGVTRTLVTNGTTNKHPRRLVEIQARFITVKPEEIGKIANTVQAECSIRARKATRSIIQHEVRALKKLYGWQISHRRESNIVQHIVQ